VHIIKPTDESRCYFIDDADDELIDLIVDTVELDKDSDSRLLYRMMKRK